MVAVPNTVAAKQPSLTPQEYLEIERKAETKSEYHDGVLVAMAGVSWAHFVITSNIVTELNIELKNSPCVAGATDMKVWVEACRKFFYPDVLVVCGEPQFHDTHRDYLTNPVLIMEVLSESTAETDRGAKFICYQTLESLNTYVLVSQDTPRCEIYVRQSDGSWRYTRVEGLEAVVTLDALNCTLRLADIYARVPFPAPEEAAEPGD